MSRVRILVAAAGITLFVALVGLGCSGSDEGEAKAAALVDVSGFQMTSPSFTEVRPKVRIPLKNTCYDENISPPLTWTGVPDSSKSLALVAEDIDHDPGVWVHWVLYNIPPDMTELTESIPTSTDVLPDGTTQGTNDFRTIGYNGPCPIRNVLAWEWYRETDQRGTQPAHKYHFRLYALDTELELAPGATKYELLDAIEGHVLGHADTVGKFQVAPAQLGKEDLGRSLYVDQTRTAGGEKIYNTFGDLITPTPIAP